MGDEDDWCDDSAEFQRLNAVYVDLDEAVGESGLYKYQHVGPWYIIACPNAAEPFDSHTHRYTRTHPSPAVARVCPHVSVLCYYLLMLLFV